MHSFINLAHLKFFCDTVIHQSISEAAKKNFISQSAVSQAINKLENIFGVPLLVHNKQKLYLTEQGQIVFDQATEIFKSINETFVKVNHTKEEITGDLKFVTTKSLGMSFFPSTYRNSKQKLPFVNIKIKMGGMTVIRTALKREEVEFAIVVYDHNFDQFAKHTIRKGHFNLYEPKNASKDLMENGIFIDEFAGMYVHDLADFLARKNFQFNAHAIAGWELVANFTNLGIGVGFFPDYIASETRFPNIKPYSLKLPSFEYEIAAIYNKCKKLSKAAEAFLTQFSLE